MHPPLADLPPPSDERSGWPWEPAGAPALPEGVAAWPRISIVTPSYNQVRFIECTIRSILLQGYPNLEYIIIDGGSTDGTLDVVRKYEPWISRWVSEPDRGMYDAINKGFAVSTGEIMAWSPADDLYVPGALGIIGAVFSQLPRIEWLTSLYKIQYNEDGQETARYRVSGFSGGAFRKGYNVPGGSRYASHSIQQQSTFWRRSLWERAGGRMDDSMCGAADFDLWCRFYHHAELYALDQPIGVFRTRAGQVSERARDQMQQEQDHAFLRNGGRYVGRLEGVFRRCLMRRRPLVWLRCLPGLGFTGLSVQWSGHECPAEIRKYRFV